MNPNCTKISLSVIIATKDRFKDIKICVENIINQSVIPSTIIIVDASKKSGVYEILKDDFNNNDIQFLYIRSKPGLAYQRNLGINENRNDFILFLDDDVTLDKYYIEEMIAYFENVNNEIGGITGKITNDKKLGVISSIIRKLFFLSENGRGEVKKSWANNNYNKISEISRIQWISGCNQFYKSEVFKYELFDENLDGYAYMEDVDFSYRVSNHFQLIFNPKAKCIHNHKNSISTRMRKREKQKMFMRNHYYLFKKNIPQTKINKLCHYWSYLGFIVRGVIFERNLGFVLGTIEGIAKNIFNKNELINNNINE